MIAVHKYLALLHISWQNGFVYRTSVFMWRFRQFLGTVMALTIWTVIFADSASFGTYNHAEMITYIFVVALFQNVVLASILNGLADQVYSGSISYHLLKPVNLFGYFALQDIADKAKNTAFIILETGLLLVLFKPEVILPGLAMGMAVVGMIVLATILNFLISLMFGAIGFWSPDTWGPRFLFFMLLDFTAGRLYPLDILPDVLQKLVMLTPFPYLSFIQTQMFLGKLDWPAVALHFSILMAWIIAFMGLSYVTWKKGLHNYAAVGQ